MTPGKHSLFGFIAPSSGSKKRDVSWVEDSFVFEAAIGRQTPLPQSRWHVANTLQEKTYTWFFILCFATFGIMFLRLGFLQIVHGADYRALAEGNRERTVPIPAERGLIFDRTGLQLTTNIPNFSLALVPQDLPRSDRERKRIVERLAQITGKPVDELWQTIKNYGNYSYKSIIIEENLNYDTALSIHIAIADLPGLYIERGSKRLYNYAIDLPGSTETESAVTLSHVIGYEGKLTPNDMDKVRDGEYLPNDTLGKTGIEKVYEEQLRGDYGTKQIEVNVLGKQQQVLSEEAPIPGRHLRLNIDARAQAMLESILKRQLELLKKDRASAVAIDPRNGSIIALVSLPTFDNNDFSGGITESAYQRYISNEHRPLFNRAIGGAYPSGSSVKPAIAAIALDEGVISSRTSIMSIGGVQVGPWFFPDWQTGGHGPTDVRKSLAYSVNTFYYYIGGGYQSFDGLGIDRLANGLKNFGFAERHRIDLPGEATGFIPTPEWKKRVKNEDWYVGDTYNLSIGQGDFLVSPLQIALMTAAIANGGTLWEPRVVRSIIDPVTKHEESLPARATRKNIIDAKYLAVVRQGMRDCVTAGSCQHLSRLPFAAAGKTGTAQWSAGRNAHAWFTSFGPFENPEIVLTVLIEEGGEGGIASAPVARDFYAWWWKYTHSGTRPTVDNVIDIKTKDAILAPSA